MCHAQQHQILTLLDLQHVLQTQSDCARHVSLHRNLIYIAVWGFPGLDLQFQAAKPLSVLAVTTQIATSQPSVRPASALQLKHTQRDALRFEVLRPLLLYADRCSLTQGQLYYNRELANNTTTQNLKRCAVALST